MLGAASPVGCVSPKQGQITGSMEMNAFAVTTGHQNSICFHQSPANTLVCSLPHAPWTHSRGAPIHKSGPSVTHTALHSPNTPVHSLAHSPPFSDTPSLTQAPPAYNPLPHAHPIQSRPPPRCTPTRTGQGPLVHARTPSCWLSGVSTQRRARAPRPDREHIGEDIFHSTITANHPCGKRGLPPSGTCWCLLVIDETAHGFHISFYLRASTLQRPRLSGAVHNERYNYEVCLGLGFPEWA